MQIPELRLFTLSEVVNFQTLTFGFRHNEKRREKLELAFHFVSYVTIRI